MTHANAERQARIRDDIRAERHRQHELYGDQTHLPMGTGQPGSFGELWAARAEYLDAYLAEGLTFAHILAEEVAEVMTETDPTKLRTELIQVAAVCVQWIEAIDGRTTDA